MAGLDKGASGAAVWLRAARGESWRATWRLLGSSAALSPIVTLLYLPFGLVGPLIIDPARLGGRWSDWLLVGLVGQLALMLVFALGRWVLHRGGTDRSPIGALIVMGAAIIARAFVLACLVPILGLSDNFEFGYRIGSSLVAQFGVLLIFSVVVSAQVQHGRQAAALEAQREALAEVNRTMWARLDETISTLRAEVRRTIDPLIHDVDAALEALTGKIDVAPLRESIRSAVDDDLRPLSHRLAITTDVDEVLAAVESRHAPGRSPLPARLPVARLSKPVLFGLLMALITTSQSLREFSFPLVLSFPIFSGIFVALLMAAVRGLIGRWVPPLWWGISVVGVVGGASVLSGVLLQSVLGLPVPRFINGAAFLVGAMVAVLIALYAAVDQRRADTEEALRASILELMEASSLLRMHAFAARRHLSYVIHGSIQGALHAAALRLATLDKPDDAVIATIRHDIFEATARLDEPVSPNVMLVDTLQEITDLWSGSCDVKWTMDHRTVRALAESPVAGMSITEIVRECVTNAVRHGCARSVTVQIQRSGEGRVVLDIADDGIGSSASAAPGLGSHMLDEMCVSWRRNSEASGTRVVAEVAIAPMPVG
jgi:signal transduction histidine kinase